jgi:hypothetical protein
MCQLPDCEERSREVLLVADTAQANVYEVTCVAGHTAQVEVYDGVIDRLATWTTIHEQVFGDVRISRA